MIPYNQLSKGKIAVEDYFKQEDKYDQISIYFLNWDYYWLEYFWFSCSHRSFFAFVFRLVFLLRWEVKFILFPVNRTSFPVILSLKTYFYCLWLSLKYTKHFSLAFVNPFIQKEISDFHIFALILKAFDNDYFNKANPIGYSLN